MKNSFNGLFGIEIFVGDFVSYPGRCGSDIWMRCGFVVKICDDCIKIARGIKYDTFDVINNVIAKTQYFIYTYTITNTHLVGRLDFSLTHYNNPLHEEYSIYQEIIRDIQKSNDKYEMTNEG